MRWHSKICRLARMEKRMQAGLFAAAKLEGSNPYAFWGTLQPVSREHWVAIEAVETGPDWRSVAAL
jgi:hypothetical protein